MQNNNKLETVACFVCTFRLAVTICLLHINIISIFSNPIHHSIERQITICIYSQFLAIFIISSEYIHEIIARFIL